MSRADGHSRPRGGPGGGNAGHRGVVRPFAAWLPWLCLIAVAAGVGQAGDGPLFEPRGAEDGLLIVGWDRPSVREAAAEGRPISVTAFPLRQGLAVDLELEPFSATRADTRFVLGAREALDRPMAFDPSTVSLFRGKVVGHAGSFAMLALSDRHATGTIALGPGRERFRIASRDAEGRPLPAGRVAIYEETPGSPTLHPDVPLCGVGDHPVADPLRGPDAAPAGASTSSRGLRHLELAVETDYEFFQLFGNADDAAAYLVTLYGAMSLIYERDTGTRIELVYARIWDDPDDLFNIVQPSPLSDFRSHWNDFMGDVDRDVAQLMSGRRDYPFGGQAYLGTLCGASAYSVVGYVSGVLADPSRPSPYQYDISVAAHELGHNCDAFHTQNYGIDSCQDPGTTAQRGPIMSYCGQTWSGGNANRDLYFHAVPAGDMIDHLTAASCVVVDCNRNSIDDATDILLATSPDTDGNGVPDECEDCNENGVLDDADIAGASLDLNANAIPDECEPDCNDNGVPDDQDIADGTSLDRHGNVVPDECEADCNTNGTSDYHEIQLDMTLDVDRDTRLDACQDCDTDGTTDFQALDGGHNLWVASGLAGSPVREFYSTTGVLTQVSGGATVDEGQDLIVAPNGNLWVSSAGDNRVIEFDRSGAYVQDFVAGGALVYPTGMVLAPDGRLLVASRDTDAVLAYDGSSGISLGAFVPSGSGGLDAPFGLTFGPDGRLYVTSDTGEVLAYDGQTGAFDDTFVEALDNGGLDQPRGLAFKPDGNLLVASFGSNETLEFDGATGAALGRWAQVGTSSVLTQVSPWGVRIGPNGNVFIVRTGEDFGVTGGLAHEHHDDDHDADDEIAKIMVLHLSNAQIYEFDVRNGNFIRSHIGGNDHGLLFPTGFAFVPGWDADCNFNQLPDACDIQSGASQDLDTSGVPDECELDCNGNGVLDRLDVIPFGPAVDCNFNRTPDTCDIASGTSADCTLNGIPDECEPDCDANGVADSCDIAAGASRDCNANGVPDECDVFEDLDQGALPGWTAGVAGDTATDGQWELANPVGTSAQPEFDHTPGAGRVCFVTGQGTLGGAANADDLDGGRTTLVTSVLDLSTFADPEVGYWRWFSNQAGANPAEDVLTVEITSDGLTWYLVETVGPSGPEAEGGWYYHGFHVADIVTPSSAVRLRFIAEDLGGNSLVEAAIDDLVVVPDCCQSAVSCGDGLGCTVDLCDVASGQCRNEIDAGSCLIGGACHDEGDLDPGDVCAVCDPALPDDWSLSLPVEVGGVALAGAGLTQLSWSVQPGALFDVAGGEIDALQAGGGVGAAACLVDDLATGIWDDTRPAPPAGGGYYYLIRAQKPCADGTYGTASSGVERQPAVACP